MAISDTLRRYSIPYEKPTSDARFLAMALSEIQSELQSIREQFGKTIPAEVVNNIDTSTLEAAIAELKSGFPGPVPPVNVDLNPVVKSYEETTRTIRELLGEVKTTNARVSTIRGGGGGPSVVGIQDATGNRLKINSDGTINTSSAIDGGNAYSTESTIDGGGA